MLAYVNIPFLWQPFPPLLHSTTHPNLCPTHKLLFQRSLPVMLNGLAIAVTYMSEQARLTMKIDSTVCSSWRRRMDSMMSRLPNVPARAATATMISTGTASSGCLETNSFRAKNSSERLDVISICFIMFGFCFKSLFHNEVTSNEFLDCFFFIFLFC